MHGNQLTHQEREKERGSDNGRHGHLLLLLPAFLMRAAFNAATPADEEWERGLPYRMPIKYIAERALNESGAP